MKVLFVDVGQGTCQIILLGEGRAIVIDAGAQSSTAHRILKLNRISRIELLAISHSHSDHAGGVVSTRKKQKARGTCSTGILVDYQDCIQQIGFVQDSSFINSNFGKYLVKLIKDKKIREDQLIRLERTNYFWPLWPAHGRSDTETLLTCISPSAAGSVVANRDENVNASSAIIELRHKGDRIIFTGDSDYAQWDSLIEHRKAKGVDGPIVCKAMTMPHHGGLMKGDANDLKRFADDTTGAEVVVFSVGTANGHKHPRPEVVRAIRDSGAYVICTQITSQCCSDLESVRPGVIGELLIPCRSSSKAEYQYQRKTRDKKRVRLRSSRNVACAGTVEAMLDDTGITISHVDKHRAGVDVLEAAGHRPLCRVLT